MGRSPCCDHESGLKKGPWTPEEDQKLVEFIQNHGHGSWRALPKLAGLNRCGKSCRLRWTNYLRPDIKRGKFSQEEEQTIMNLHSVLGNKWSAIASHLPGRTDNEIKNFWNTHLRKKLIQMGFDPMTHMPRTDIFSNLENLIALANLMDFPDQHSLRLQLEALEMAKVQSLQYLLQLPQTTTPTTSTMTKNHSSSNFGEMEILNLLSSLSSIKDDHSPMLMDQNQILPFSHLPKLEISCTKDHDDQVMSNQAPDQLGAASRNSLGFSNEIASSSVADQPIFDASSSINVLESSWPELFLNEDPLFQEMIPN